MTHNFDQRQARAAAAGFTLIEVLIAMLIATMGFLALGMMQGNAIQANSFSNKLTQATILAQAKMEQLNSTLLSPDNADDDRAADLNVGEHAPLEGIDVHGNHDPDHPGPFTLQWAVAPNTDYSRKITVTVTWTNRLNGFGIGKTHKVQFSSVTRGVYYDGNT